MRCDPYPPQVIHTPEGKAGGPGLRSRQPGATRFPKTFLINVLWALPESLARPPWRVAFARDDRLAPGPEPHKARNRQPQAVAPKRPGEILPGRPGGPRGGPPDQNGKLAPRINLRSSLIWSLAATCSSARNRMSGDGRYSAPNRSGAETSVSFPLLRSLRVKSRTAPV